jgi:elongation factor Ts
MKGVRPGLNQKIEAINNTIYIAIIQFVRGRMMTISAHEVKTLRDKTGAGMMDCKKALEEAKGDFEKAKNILRERGLSRAAKRIGKPTDEGVIEGYLSGDGKTGALIELNCETDFVARTPDFKDFAHKLCQLIGEKNPQGDEWKDLKFDGEKALEKLSILSAKVGEKIELRRFVRYQAGGGLLEIYIHAGSRVGVMIEVEGEGEKEKLISVAHELALQIAASNPLVVCRKEVAGEAVEKELEIYRAQARNEGKPEKVIDRIAEGKLNKYYEEVCLLEQPFIREQKIKVQQYLDDMCKKSGIKVTPLRFIKYALGGS